MQEPQTAAELRAHYAALKKRTQWHIGKPVAAKPKVIPIKDFLAVLIENSKTETLPDRVEAGNVFTPPFSMTEIVDAVSRITGVSVVEIKGCRRLRHITHARHLAIWFCVALVKKSYTHIGRFVAGFDHSSVIHALRKIDFNREQHAVVIDKISVALGVDAHIGRVYNFEAREWKRWTHNEVSLLKDMIRQGLCDKEIARAIRRPVLGVQKKRWSLVRADRT